MAVLTLAQLTTSATELAGNTQLDAADLAQRWAQLVLESLYSQFDMPWVGGRSTTPQVPAGSNFTLPAGTRVMYFGQTTGSPAYSSASRVRGVRRLLLAPTGTDDFQDVGLVTTETAGNGLFTATASNASRVTGRPVRGIVEGANFPSTGNQGVSVTLFPVPEREYIVHALLLGIPSEVDAVDTTKPPPWPRGATVLQGVLAYCYRHQDDPREFAAFQLFENMAKEDVARVNASLGRRNIVTLSRNKFAGAPRRGPLDWMGPS